MCCNRINADTLLANLFAASGEAASYTLDELTDYLRILSSQSPEYIATDFCESAIKECAENYPEFYRLSRHNGKLSVSAGELRPDAADFNRAYSSRVTRYMEKATAFYLERRSVVVAAV